MASVSRYSPGTEEADHSGTLAEENHPGRLAASGTVGPKSRPSNTSATK